MNLQELFGNGLGDGNTVLEPSTLTRPRIPPDWSSPPQEIRRSPERDKQRIIFVMGTNASSGCRFQKFSCRRVTNAWVSPLRANRPTRS